MRPKIRFAALSLLLAPSLFFSSVSEASAASQTVSVTEAAPIAETVAYQVQKVADQFGALDLGFDTVNNQFLVRLPKGTLDLSGVSAGLAALGVTSKIGISQFSPDSLEALNNNFMKRDWTEKASTYSYFAYYDAGTDKLHVAGTAPVSVIEPFLDANTGEVSYIQDEGAGRTSRAVDGPPHKGGAGITNGGGRCSTGFTVLKDTGYRAILTAGHCFSGLAGQTIYDASMTNVVGKLKGVTNYPTFDDNLVQTDTYSRDVYTGGGIGTPVPVASAADPAVGGSYCNSGSTTFEHCGEEVFNLHGKGCSADGCTLEMAVARGVDTQDGDSGGPFYAKTGGVTDPIKARGIIGGNAGGDNYYEKWSRIVQNLNVTIVTTT